MLDWAPDAGSRRVGRPVSRWEDSILDFAKAVGVSWKVLAQDRDRWEELEPEFVKFGRSKAAQVADRTQAKA